MEFTFTIEQFLRSKCAIKYVLLYFTAEIKEVSNRGKGSGSKIRKIIKKKRKEKLRSMKRRQYLKRENVV